MYISLAEWSVGNLPQQRILVFENKWYRHGNLESAGAHPRENVERRTPSRAECRDEDACVKHDDGHDL